MIFLYSLIFTSLVSFFAVMLIPDGERTHKYIDNLIGGLAMHLVGPVSIRLLFHGFVVLVGTLILSGAVNTAIIGSNGVLNRVAEDGVLTDWFRHPHRKFGTTHHLINLIVILQIGTIILSRGDVIVLGEAYAFGVVWSFAMKALSVLVLRYKQPEGREWKVPLNFRIGGKEIPVGLGLIALTLILLALINLVTKKTATITGLSFSIVLFTIFELSERYNRKRHANARPAWSNSAWIPTTISRANLCTCGPAMCWWRCATLTIWSTWSAFCRRPTPARSTSWRCRFAK